MAVLLPEVHSQTGEDDDAFAKILLITGGRAPDSTWLKKIAAGKKIYCADHGLDICLRAGLTPDYILGDGDSAAADNWQAAKSMGVPFEQFPSAKDLTDTQLALQIIGKYYAKAQITVTACWGGRFDHLYSSMFSLAALAGKNMRVCAADEKEVLFYLSDERAMFHCMQKPLSISLLSFSSICEKVSIDNVRWPLKNVTLKQNEPYAVSNETAKMDFTVSAGKGMLGVYLCWSEFLK